MAPRSIGQSLSFNNLLSHIKNAGMFTYASQAVSCLQAKYVFAREAKAPTNPKIIATSVSRLNDHGSSRPLAIVVLSWSSDMLTDCGTFQGARIFMGFKSTDCALVVFPKSQDQTPGRVNVLIYS